MRRCHQCGGGVGDRYRFCPWCAAPQRRKLVEFFRAHRGLEQDAGKALRVSRYLEGASSERHVRFSVWNESGEAQAAVSIDELEAARLARFLGEIEPRATGPLGGLLESLKKRIEA
jgi:hypothetical protein